MARKKTTRRRKSRQPKILKTRTFSAAAKNDLKQFRKSISALKKIGLAFSKTKTRSAKKSSRSLKLIEQYRDVLEGKAKVHKIGKKGAAQFKKASLPGTRIKGEKIIVPVEPGTITYTRSGNLYRKRVAPGGAVIHRTKVLPVPVYSTSLQDFIDNLKNNPSLERELRKGNQWAFRFFGHNSYATFDDLGLLADYWENYESIQLTLRESLEQQQEVIEALEIFQLERGTNLAQIAGYSRLPKPRKYKRSEYAKTLYQRTKIRNPAKHERTLAKARVAANKRYEQLKNDPEKYEAYLKSHREKAQQRYAKRAKSTRNRKKK